jgi:hypothetical protein
MQTSAIPIALGTLLLTPLAAYPSTDREIAELRALVDQMKVQYERRISDLEARLAKAEGEATRTTSDTGAPRRPSEVGAARAVEPAVSKPMTAERVIPPTTQAPSESRFGALTSAHAFNPQIAVFLDGNYYHDTIDGEGGTLVGLAYQPSRLLTDAGHDHDYAEDGQDQAEDSHLHAHGAPVNGFNFREAEIAFSGTVDPYFDAALYLSVDGDGDVELEEGYFQTRSLPAGLRIKGGKFLSDFGYINRQHPHQWDFVDQNLPYLNLLGSHGLLDTGLQVTWLPELPVYTLIGAEAFQGNQEIFGATLDGEAQNELALGRTDDGPRLWTAFAKLAPDLGPNHALQLGVSYAHNTQHQAVQVHTHEHEGEHADEDGGHEIEIHRNGLAGNADLWGIDLVYKYAGSGAYGHRDLLFQSEYLYSSKDMRITASPHTELIGSNTRFMTDGLYAQTVYGFAPRWTAGLRYDVLGLTNQLRGIESADFGASDRWTLDVTWNLSEFSKLRAQYAYNNILETPDVRQRFDAFYLQFLVSLGAHGPHAF